MTIDEGDMTLAKNCLEYSKLSDQNLVSRYEKRFSKWNKSKEAFAFMSGREALSACIDALGLSNGDKAIIPAYTCVVVPNAFNYQGIEIEYVDIELDTFGIDATELRSKITDDTDAVLLQHLYGLVSRDYEEIIKIANSYNAYVIEDCAHATGATYKNEPVGNRGDVAFFSTEKSKVYTTIQGGMAITNRDDIASGLEEYYQTAPYPDDDLVEDILYNILLNYGTNKHPYRRVLSPLYQLKYRNKKITSTTDTEIKGVKPEPYGRRMPAPLAALGLNQLKKIDYYNNKRRQNAQRWQEWCINNDYQPPLVIEDSEPVFLRYPVLVEPEKKENLLWANRKLGVHPGVWFEGKLHPKDIEIPSVPNAETAVNRCINLPCLYDRDRYENETKDTLFHD